MWLSKERSPRGWAIAGGYSLLAVVCFSLCAFAAFTFMSYLSSSAEASGDDQFSHSFGSGVRTAELDRRTINALEGIEKELHEMNVTLKKIQREMQ